MTDIKAIEKWTTNGHLIEACRKLGYIHGDVLDPTYGLGTFWNQGEPESLVRGDIRPTSDKLDLIMDFTAPPFERNSFDSITFDPPYKLNGTPTEEVDDRYGVASPATWQERMELCREGIRALALLLRPKGHLLVKCQDQVVSGHVRWQTHDFTLVGESVGLTLEDALHFPGGRAQPAGRSQKHARRNYSTMLVLTRVNAQRTVQPS